MTKVVDIMELVFPAYRPVLTEMLDREGMNGDTTVAQVFAHFLPDNIKSPEERVALGALGGALNKHTANKFSPKLSLTKHCEILALYRMGYNADLLAKAYGVDRKTVTHMYNPQSPKYKGVKGQEKIMGTDGLIRVYVTDVVLAHIKNFETPVEELSNKYANKKEGVHLVQGINCTFKHRLEIRWCEPDEVEVKGWYYKDMDGDFPEAWIRGDDDSMKNSQACLNFALKDISDPL